MKRKSDDFLFLCQNLEMFDLLGIHKEKISLLNDQGIVDYYPNFFDDNYFDRLQLEIPWVQEEITLYGKTHKVPRLSCWLSDENLSYTYSGIKHSANICPKSVLEIKYSIEGFLSRGFNSCLANLYRNGADYAAWHSDDEKELGLKPLIASASFGATRFFHLRHKTDKSKETLRVALENNSLLIMSGSLQHYWKHQLAKTSKACEPRINLTFRNIIS